MQEQSRMESEKRELQMTMEPMTMAELKRVMRLAGRPTNDASLAFLCIGLAQRRDHYLARKRITEKHNAKIVEIQRQIDWHMKMMEKAMNEEPAALEPAMSPPSQQAAPPPDPEVVERHAVKKDKAEAEAARSALPKYDATLVSRAVEMFGQAVMLEHFMQHCNQGGYKEPLIAYARKKILQLDAEGEVLQANISGVASIPNHLQQNVENELKALERLCCYS